MDWLRNNLVFLAALLLIAVAVILMALFNNAAIAAFGILALSTALNAISSIAAYMQTIEARRQREDAERPEIAVYFKPQNRLMYCIIQNLGNLPAREVKIQFAPSPVMHDGRLLQDLTLFSKPILYLPPNEKYWRQLGASPDILQRNQTPFKIKVEYKTSADKSYVDNFEVDFSFMAEANDPEVSISAQLEKMSKSLDNFVNALEREDLMRLARDSDDPNHNS